MHLRFSILNVTAKRGFVGNLTGALRLQGSEWSSLFLWHTDWLSSADCRLVRAAWGWLCSYLMYIHFFFHPPFFSLSFLLLCSFASFVLCFFLNFLLLYCYNPCFFFVVMRFWVYLPFSLLSFFICAFVYDLFCCLYFFAVCLLLCFQPSFVLYILAPLTSFLLHFDFLFAHKNSTCDLISVIKCLLSPYSTCNVNISVPASLCFRSLRASRNIDLHQANQHRARALLRT
jgi:hypothetical protein